ncbi:hypothetical protein [Streptomyces sp. WZ-12]|uniref:hypothetical protein n=1 Tax=Streptomyces sp. WZ-12 TaxID=3030210 RepID=UPI00238110B4|nr:hypothetical protein [Streptomyces sp. WZ-12]
MSQALDFINSAKAQVGYREGANNWNKYGQWYRDNNEPWCAQFVSWNANEAGILNTKVPKYEGCSAGVAWYRNKGRFTDYPVVGGPVFYGSGGGSHTGICVAYSSSTITTIEGNTNTDGSAEGNGVYLKTRSRQSSYVYGYGIPDFDEGTVLADPSYKGKAGYIYFGEEASTSDVPNKPTPKPTPGKVTINGSVYGPGTQGDHIQYMADCLWKAGCWKGPKDAHAWGDGHTESMRAYQIAIGDADSADGVPGLKQLTRLETEHGQGLWPIQKPAPPKPDPSPKPDGNTIPKTVWLSNPSPSKVKANTWTTVDVTGKGDGTVIHSNGDCKFSSNVKIAFADVPAGATVQGRFLKFTNDGDSDGGYAVVERVATGDFSFVDFSAMGHMNTDRRLVCQVAVFGKDDQEFTISGRTAEALYWD